MRAVLLQHNGGLEALHYCEDVPAPTPRADEVLLRTLATSVNRVDIVLRQGYPGL